jgi:penicillin-binding protein 1C
MIFRLRQIALFFILLLAVVEGLGWLVARCLPTTYLLNRPGFSQAFYSQEEKLLRLSLSSDEKYRLFLSLDQVSPNFIAAVLAQEDRWFYYHPGINPYALLRGAVLTYFEGHRTGGSTISMQLARIRYGIVSRTFVGKLKQMFLALFLERLYSKSELLEAYINLASFGGNIEGVGAASLIYLNRSAASLSIPESVYLAVIPESPTRRSPTRQQNYLQQAAERLWLRLPESQRSSQKDFKIMSLAGRVKDLPKVAMHFTNQLAAAYPFKNQIVTSLNFEQQKTLEKQVAAYISRNSKFGLTNASAMLLDCQSNAIRAYVGSANFWDNKIQGQVDGIRARRSPGSALKPFIYALAIEHGIIHPGTILKDLNFSRAAYNPENYEKDFVGPISATDALVRSRNIPAVRLLNSIGPEGYIEFLKQAEIAQLRSAEYYGLALALGGVEVRPDEVARLYCSLNNQGKLSPINRLKSQLETTQTSKLLFSPESAFLVKEMLKENDPPPSFLNSRARVKDLRIAWKTGTSFGFRDAWAAGLPGRYALVVWLGNFDGRGAPALIGRDSAGVLFFKIIEALSANEALTEAPVSKELNVKKVAVCAVSGDLPSSSCTRKHQSWYLPGKSPVKVCQIHRTIAVDSETGLATCSRSKSKGVSTVFEVWPSDMQELFLKAGIKFKRPPQYGPECLGIDLAGQAPEIVSPQSKVTYNLEAERKEIPLIAVTDADVTTLTWYDGDLKLAQVKAGQTWFWPASVGQHRISAIDDRGRVTSLEVQITTDYKK